MPLRPLALCALCTTLTLTAAGCGADKQAAPGSSATPAAPAATPPATGAAQPAAAPATPALTPGAPAAPEGLPFEATGPVATIDGVEISAERFNAEVRKMAGRIPPNVASRYKDRVLDTLVTDTLVEDAFKALKIQVADEAVAAEFAKFSKDVAANSPGGVAEFYAKAGVDEAGMKERIRKSLTFVALLEKKGHSVKVTDADAQAFYDGNKAKFSKQDQVKASHILLKLDKGADDAKTAAVEARAKELYAKAKAPGADFAALAKAHSEGPSGPRGGDLGFFEKNRMVPAFANAAWAMKPGEISAPVKTQFGFHVIKLVERKGGGQTPLAEVKEQIVGQLENNKRREASQAVIGELTKAAKIERLAANIKVNVRPTAVPSPDLGLGLGLGAPRPAAASPGAPSARAVKGQPAKAPAAP